MTKIMPAFRNEDDRIITIAVILTSIFFVFIPSLIAILCLKDKLSDEACGIIKSIFNFELFIFIISLFFMIPIIGWFAGFFITPVLAIWNAIVMIIALCSIAKGKEVSVPVPYEFL